MSPGTLRVRIRYTAGECSLVEGFVWLLARLATSYLCSPFLCGVDLRCAGWDFYDLATTENEQTDETKETTAFDDVLDGTVDKSERVITTTGRVLTTVAQKRMPFPKDLYQCPFGPTKARYDMWQYLRPKKRVRAWRL